MSERDDLADVLPVHAFDCDRFQVYDYGARQGTCDCTATATVEALAAERDALAATVQRVRALCDGPPMHPKAPLYVRISAVRAVLDERGDIKGFGDG